jgi:hypothetical protein
MQKTELASRLPLLNSVKAKIEELTEHKDIKVCNTAREMLSRYSRHENDESSSSSSNTPVNTPTTNRLTQSRKRSFMMTQSSPVLNQVKSPGQTTSPSRPALEDLDSQVISETSNLFHYSFVKDQKLDRKFKNSLKNKTHSKTKNLPIFRV